MAHKRTRLRFLLGEVSLFSFRFPAQIDQCFLKGTPSGPALPPEGAAALVRLSEEVPDELPRLTFLPGTMRYVPSQYARYFVDLSGGFTQYLARFSGKSRNTLLRKVRKFAELSGGALVWRRFDKPEEMAEFHALARAVSAKTYQERLLDAGLPDTPGFRRQLETSATAGRIRGYVLFHQGSPAAYAYCKSEGDALTYDLLGHDPALQQWSPGTVLLYQILEDLFDHDGFRYFDFGGGEAPYKQFFSTGGVQCADVYYFRRTARNMTMLLMHTGLHRFSNALVHGLESLGVKARAKKLLRQLSLPEFGRRRSEAPR